MESREGLFNLIRSSWMRDRRVELVGECKRLGYRKNRGIEGT